MDISLHIKNIGPLTDTTNVKLSRFNVIIGKQSTGKSTFLKILSFCQWLEKKIMTSNDGEILYNYTHYYRFVKELKSFHRFDERFFSNNSEIHYQSDYLKIDFVGKKNAQIVRLPDFEQHCHNTKISFIPSERNLVSVLRNVDRTYRANDMDHIFNHIFEWSDAKEHTSEKRPVDLSMVGDMEYFYDASADTDQIRLKNQNRIISPFYASSGVQSVLPIVVMINYFTSNELYDNSSLSKYDIDKFFKQLQSTKAEPDSIQKLVDRFSFIHKYQNTKLFIEEPEQNLFPESQQELINFMVERINQATEYTKMESTLTITTHSPYIITAFNVLIRAAYAAEKDREKVYNIVPKDSLIPLKKVNAYYIGQNGNLVDIMDREIGMISGVELDNASSIVEDKLAVLNDVIYG